MNNQILRRLSFLTAVSLLAGIGCAPSRARAVRDDKSLTLGYVGVSYRPTGKISVGTSYRGSAETTTKMNNGSAGMSSFTVSSGRNEEAYANRDIKTSYSVISPFVHLYPSDTSAFYIGLGASMYSSRSEFGEETTADSTTLAPAYTEVDYQTKANYIGAPVGWAWIWESGFSFSLDFGPRFRLNQSTSYGNDGSAAGVDAEKRNETKEYLDSRMPVVAMGGNGIIGWSF